MCTRTCKTTKWPEVHRVFAEAQVLTIANSFGSDEPLRQSFLAATPCRPNSQYRKVEKQISCTIADILSSLFHRTSKKFWRLAPSILRPRLLRISITDQSGGGTRQK